jgi:hypothetical protein
MTARFRIDPEVIQDAWDLKVSIPELVGLSPQTPTATPPACWSGAYGHNPPATWTWTCQTSGNQVHLCAGCCAWWWYHAQDDPALRPARVEPLRPTTLPPADARPCRNCRGAGAIHPVSWCPGYDPEDGACQRCHGDGALQEVDADGRPVHTEDPCTACHGTGIP